MKKKKQCLRGKPVPSAKPPKRQQVGYTHTHVYKYICVEHLYFIFGKQNGDENKVKEIKARISANANNGVQAS